MFVEKNGGILDRPSLSHCAALVAAEIGDPMRKLMRKQIILFIAALFLWINFADAQTATSGRLTGVVSDARKGVIPGAVILAKNEQTGAEFRAVADETGTWLIPSVPPGDYTVMVTALAFATAVFRQVAVAPDAATTVNSTMTVGISETVVVSASRIEEELVNAPAAVSVITETTIRDAPTQNFADLLRSIPGVNVMQVSARDFNVTPRSATMIPAASQLVLIDGRTINQDYIGYVAWDFIPTSLNDVKQVEVLRGPASAVWGANAMNGVVNIVTKSAREMAGSTFTIGAGAFDRAGGIADSDTGTLFYVSASHARVINDQWAFRLSGGYFANDPFARPAGTIPNQYLTPYPPFKNYGTKQPKVDAGVDYDFPDGQQHVSISGGYAATGGTFHTGLGPFRLEDGARGGYGRFAYSRGGLSVRTFANLWQGDARSLLSVGPLGDPLNLYFNNKTWDIDLSNSHSIRSRHLLSYGGNYRHNWFNITMAPGGKKRDEGGAYIQDEILLSEHFRWIVGSRVDKFDILDKPVFSPRTAFLIKPVPGQTFRISYSRAYRVPGMFHNYLDTVVVNRLDLGLFVPPMAGTFYYFPVSGVGNLNLEEQTLNAYEAGYVATVARGRVGLGASFYVTDSRNDFVLGQTGSYTSTNPPPGWPLPPLVLDLLIAQNVFGPGLGLPSIIGYQNLGTVRNKGVEASIDAQLHRFVKAYANCSWQAQPVPKDFQLSLLNLPPRNRFNAGLGLDRRLFLGSLDVQYTDTAYWRDVLDASYAGWTQAYTVVNTSVGVRLGGGKCMLMLKVNNLANEKVQNHLFGDLLKRQIVGEMRLRF
jgi:iron complex outermembrane receptor protein